MTEKKNAALLKYMEELELRLHATEVPKKHKGTETEYKAYLKLEMRRTKLRLETDPVNLPKGAA